MTTRWHIGAKDLRGAIAAYAKRFNLLEVRITLGSPTAPGAPGFTPGLPTLKRWRKSVPPHFDFAVVAGPALSRTKPGDEADRELEAARVAMDALQARCFVLRTPADVTPASIWRERIRRIVDRVPHDVTNFVWEPSGLWEAEDATAAARSWGIVAAVDPAREAVPAGPVAYLRLRALGETRAFGAVALERIVRAVGERRDVYAVVETDTALKEAKRLRTIIKTVRPGVPVGGGARLVRPRGGIVVRDDEQE
jgi:uncharacterized protein YecE (DUF72 family)